MMMQLKLCKFIPNKRDRLENEILDQWAATYVKNFFQVTEASSDPVNLGW